MFCLTHKSPSIFPTTISPKLPSSPLWTAEFLAIPHHSISPFLTSGSILLLCLPLSVFTQRLVGIRVFGVIHLLSQGSAGRSRLDLWRLSVECLEVRFITWRLCKLSDPPHLCISEHDSDWRWFRWQTVELCFCSLDVFPYFLWMFHERNLKITFFCFIRARLVYRIYKIA